MVRRFISKYTNVARSISLWLLMSLFLFSSLFIAKQIFQTQNRLAAALIGLIFLSFYFARSIIRQNQSKDSDTDLPSDPLIDFLGLWLIISTLFYGLFMASWVVIKFYKVFSIAYAGISLILLSAAINSNKSYSELNSCSNESLAQAEEIDEERNKEKAQGKRKFYKAFEIATSINAGSEIRKHSDKYKYAKKLILDATSALSDDCTGEAKHCLISASSEIESCGEFGKKLANLIKQARNNIYNYNSREDRSDLHRMVWDCSRAITLQIQQS